MPEIVITPKALAIIILATAGREVTSFMVQLSDQLAVEAQTRALNLAIQYGAVAIGQAAVQSNGLANGLDVTAPAKLFTQGLESMTQASSPEEAAVKGSIAAATLLLSGLSTKDPNASLTFGGFLIVFAQNVLMSGSQIIFSKGLLKIYVIKNLVIKLITEIRVELKRRKLKLPRAKLKFNIFSLVFSVFRETEPEKRDFIFKYPRFKKRKLKIFSRQISIPVLYQKERIIRGE